MGRPLRTRETVVANPNGSSTNIEKTGVIGLSSKSGEQITMQAYIATDEGGSAAAVSSVVVQKGTKKFRITNSEGTSQCQLVAEAASDLATLMSAKTDAATIGLCQLTATDSASGTYFVSRIGPNWIEIGKLGTGSQVAVGDRVQWLDDQQSAVAIDTSTYAVGDVNQPGRFLVVTA